MEHLLAKQAEFQKEYFECLYWLARLVDDEGDQSQYEHIAAVQEHLSRMVSAYEQTFVSAFNLIKQAPPSQ